MRLLRASERVAVPWKNGGGITREVMVYPDGAGMADFDWRISIAEVDEAGPFSCFDGVDRSLSILSGRLLLGIADRYVTLAEGETLAFAGDMKVMGTPLAPVTDLNVMTRRGRFTAQVERVDGRVSLAGPESILVATSWQTVLGFAMESLDALTVEGCQEVEMRGFCIRIVPAADGRSPENL